MFLIEIDKCKFEQKYYSHYGEILFTLVLFDDRFEQNKICNSVASRDDVMKTFLRRYIPIAFLVLTIIDVVMRDWLDAVAYTSLGLIFMSYESSAKVPRALGYLAWVILTLLGILRAIRMFRIF